MLLRVTGRLRLLFALVLVFRYTPAAFGDGDLGVDNTPRAPTAAPGEIIVRFEDSVSAGARQAYFKQIGVRLKHHGYGNAFEVLTVRDTRAFDTVMGRLRRTWGVRSAEPNYYLSASSVNDPYFKPYQWNLLDTGFGIHAETAWRFSTGSGVTVAVIDTGVAYENYAGLTAAPDLGGTRFVSGYDFVKNDSHPQDYNGHGTHVCAILAESTNNNLGCAGIAYGASIMPVRVLDAYGNGPMDQVASGIRWAVDHGAQVINLSLGGSVGSAALQAALQYAESKEVVVVAAAGNSHTPSVQYPALYPNLLAVGATRFDGQLAPYSSYGPRLDLVAPGGDMRVDQNGDGYPDGILAQEPVPGNIRSFGYYFVEGTSEAAPHVSAVAAMVRSLHPDWSAAQVRQVILKTCRNLGSAGRNDTYGYGLLDAAAAVQYGSNQPDTTPPSTVTGLKVTSVTTDTVNLAWDAATDNVGVTGYRVYRDGAFLAGATTTAYSDTGRSASTSYRYSIVAYDAAGNSSTPCPDVTATTQASVPSSPGGTASAATSATSIFNFEDGSLQGWLSASSRATLSNSSGIAYDGTRSLHVSLSGVSAASTAFFYVWLPSGITGPAAGKTVHAYLYLPRTGSLQARTIVYDATYHASTGALTNLVGGAWTDVPITLPSGAAGTGTAIALQIGGPGSSFTGDVYLDAVGW